MPQNDYLRIGKITGTHGVRGEVKVFPLTDNPDRFRLLKETFLTDESGKFLDKLNCSGSKTIKNMVVLQFREITDMDNALMLKDKYLSVNRENAVLLPKNSYFICDLIGIGVYNENNEFIGNISDVISTGANDVYIIERHGMKQILIPAIKQVIKSVDLAERKVIVDLLPGLEEIYG